MPVAKYMFSRSEQQGTSYYSTGKNLLEIHSWNQVSISVLEDPERVGDQDIQNEVLASFRHQRHTGYKTAELYYPITIQCSLDEEVFIIIRVHFDISDLPNYDGATQFPTRYVVLWVSPTDAESRFRESISISVIFQMLYKTKGGEAARPGTVAEEGTGIQVHLAAERQHIAEEGRKSTSSRDKNPG
ncbi:hypothetical protein J6590_059279 [Homalodisca vitripennis]|nr:hypothetical protein J6590_059279 [Homalodisca vitripennis]